MLAVMGPTRYQNPWTPNLLAELPLLIVLYQEEDLKQRDNILVAN